MNEHSNALSDPFALRLAAPVAVCSPRPSPATPPPPPPLCRFDPLAAIRIQGELRTANERGSVSAAISHTASAAASSFSRLSASRCRIEIRSGRCPSSWRTQRQLEHMRMLEQTDMELQQPQPLTLQLQTAKLNGAVTQPRPLPLCPPLETQRPSIRSFGTHPVVCWDGLVRVYDCAFGVPSNERWRGRCGSGQRQSDSAAQQQQRQQQQAASFDCSGTVSSLFTRSFARLFV